MISEGSLGVRPPPRWLIAMAWTALLWLLPSAAYGADRIAVVLSAENAADTPLSENLEEVAIAKLAENRSGELVGTRELNRLLARTRDGKEIADCVSETECLAHLRGELAIALVVAGKLRREGTQITLELQLLDATTGKQQRHVSRTSDEAVAELVQATREGIGELFAPLPEARVREAPTPAPILALTPQSVPTARSAPILAPLPDPPHATRGWRSTVGYSSGALAVLSLSAAAVLGILAQQEPDGANRREAQTQLERERGFATTANVLWLSGGVLATVSVLAFIPLPGAAPAK